MSKLTIAPINSGYRSAEALTENFEAIAEALENTLSRDGTAPSEMGTNLDMDSNRIINLPEPVSSSEPARLADLEAIDLTADDLQDLVDQAEAATSSKADKVTTVTGAGLATGGGSLAANRTITVTEASEAEAQTGTATDKAMTPRRTTDHFNARTSSFMRTVLDDGDAATARTTLGADESVNINFLQSGGSAVTRSVRDKLRDSVSVLDFIPVNLHAGIKAGTDATDLTAYFNVAQTAARRVHVPAGTYNVNLVSAQAGRVIEGDGEGTVIRLANSANSYCIFVNGVDGFTVRNLKLDGNSANNGSIGTGIRAEGAADDLTIENVIATDFYNNGVALVGTGACSRIVGCNLNGNLKASFISSGFTDGTFEQNQCNDNGEAGAVFASASHRWKISGNTASRNASASFGGIVIANSNDCTTSNNVCHDNTGHGIQHNTALRCVATGNNCQGNGISGLDFYASPDGQSTANLLKGNAVRGLEVDTGSHDHRSIGDIAHSNGEEGISVFRSGRVHIVAPNAQKNNTTGGDGGIRFWTNTGSGATSDSDYGRVIGGCSIDTQGSPTQTYGVVVQTGTGNISLTELDVHDNLTGPVSTPDGGVTSAENCRGFSVGGALSLQNSWVVDTEARYEKGADGFVRLCGRIKDGTVAANTLIATLPVGCRPAATEYFIANVSGGYANIYIESDGEIRDLGGSLNATWSSLNGIQFRAA